MTSEEKKIFDGVLFKPGDPELRQIKLRSHNLCAKYNRTTEDETEYRAQLLEQILGGMGKGVFMQGPIFFHYGTHTTIGDKFFGNYNLTIQDDGKVTIGNATFNLDEGAFEDRILEQDVIDDFEQKVFPGYRLRFYSSERVMGSIMHTFKLVPEDEYVDVPIIDVEIEEEQKEKAEKN